MDHLDLCIKKNQTVHDAMRQLDRMGKKVLFILEDGFLSGALTDGDIRRHLLNGGKMDDIVDTVANHSPITAKNRKQAQKLLRKNALSAIPITAENGVLLDIALSAEFTEIPLASLRAFAACGVQITEEYKMSYIPTLGHEVKVFTVKKVL